jgi:hypothetical protein
MTRKIAIVLSREVPARYDEYSYEHIIDSISHWEEVTDEDYRLLALAENRLGFTIIEQPTKPREFIDNTISTWKKLAAADALKREQEKKAAEEKALQKKLKAEQKKTETKKQLLERLKAELGEK